VTVERRQEWQLELSEASGSAVTRWMLVAGPKGHRQSPYTHKVWLELDARTPQASFQTALSRAQGAWHSQAWILKGLAFAKGCE